MTDSGYKPWSLLRWCVVGGFLMGSQAAIVRYFGRPHLAEARLELPEAQVALLPPGSTDLKEEWISNPAAFALPDPVGFSGSALQWIPRTVLPSVVREPKPAYLASGTETPLGPLQELKTPISSGYLSNRSAVLPVELPSVVGSRTVVIYGKAIKGRAPETPAVLPPWQGDGLPAPSRVEAAVNPLGEVMLVRLIESSKSKPMDAQALAAVGTMRFKPLPDAEIASAHDVTQFVWSVVTVLWAPTPAETR